MEEYAGTCQDSEQKDKSSLPRRLAIASCAAAMGTLVPVALYQSGVLSHLPDPPGRQFDSDSLTEGPGSKPLGIPDSYLGFASYGATMALLLSQRRSVPMNLARHVKLGMDAAISGTKVARQIRKGKYCSWCLGTAAATGAMLWLGYLAGKQQRELKHRDE